MELKYSEIKESSQDAYNDSDEEQGYDLYNTFYFHLNDFTCHEKCNFTEKLSVYISFTVILLENNEDYSFLKEELTVLLKEANKEKIKKELDNEDYYEFEKDFDKVSRTIEKGILQ